MTAIRPSPTGRLALAGLLAAVSVAAVATPPPLSAYKDHSRVVVMFAPTAENPRFTRQSAQLSVLTRRPTFRSLIVVGVAGDTVIGVSDSAAALRRRFGVAPNAFAVVLVGKDGTVALSRSRVVSSQTLAATIDAMPMRQDELRRGQTD
jgi:hypothetical protein